MILYCGRLSVSLSCGQLFLHHSPGGATSMQPLLHYCSLFLWTAAGFQGGHRTMEREYVVEHLEPGHAYRARVCCYSAGGQSDVSYLVWLYHRWWWCLCHQCLASASLPSTRYNICRRRGVMVNSVGLIDEVNQHWAQLVLGWVTIFSDG